MDIPYCKVHGYDPEPVGDVEKSLKEGAAYQRLFFQRCCGKFVMVYYGIICIEEWIKVP